MELSQLLQGHLIKPSSVWGCPGSAIADAICLTAESNLTPIPVRDA
jgi:hypothetical protein